MKEYYSLESFLIQELTEYARQTKIASKGLSLGELIKSIRQQLGMSQQVLANRAEVPQPTVSRVEKGQKDVTLSTLNKILNALSCDLVIVPLLRDSIDDIRRKQARKIAKQQIRYLQGTMNLEDQEPSQKFLTQLLKQEEAHLLKGPNAKLWQE